MDACVSHIALASKAPSMAQLPALATCVAQAFPHSLWTLSAGALIAWECCAFFDYLLLFYDLLLLLVFSIYIYSMNFSDCLPLYLLSIYLSPRNKYHFFTFAPSSMALSAAAAAARTASSSHLTCSLKMFLPTPFFFRFFLHFFSLPASLLYGTWANYPIKILRYHLLYADATCGLMERQSSHQSCHMVSRFRCCVFLFYCIYSCILQLNFEVARRWQRDF